MAQGICRFCGQIIELAQDFGSDTENNEESVYYCSCPEARSLQEKKSQIDQANEAVDNLFAKTGGAGINTVEPDSAEWAVKLLKAAIAPIVDRQLYKISIDIPGGVKAVITRSGKDKISVERGDAAKRKLEI